MTFSKIRSSTIIACIVAFLCVGAMLNSCGGGGSEPAAPTGLTVTISDNAGELIISWTASSDAKSYNLYWGTSAGVTTATGTLIAGAASPYTHNGLTNGMRYYYIVTAVNDNGESTASAEASGLPQINPVGVLDNDLGSIGYVRYTTNTGWISGVDIDLSGRMVFTGRITIGANTYMALWRYNADGTPDTTFGGGDGLVTTTGTAGGTLDEGIGVTIDSLGRILVTGYSLNAGFICQMIIWRFMTDGTADASFGTSGVVSYDRGFGNDNWGEEILVDGSGRILVAGLSNNAADRDMALWRYTDAGELDTTFGGTGVVFQHNTAGGNGDDIGFDLAINNNGGIAVVGESWNGTNNDFVIWRFTDTGTLDTSFDGDGIVLFDRGADDRGYAITFDAQGRAVATGVSDNGTDDDFLVWRYTNMGEPDTTFNSDGVAVYDSTLDDAGWGIGMDSRQRVVAVGASGLPGGANDMAAIRYNDDGSFDTTFDTDGVVLFQYQPVSRNDGGSIAFDATGRIIIAGSIDAPPLDIYATFWRYQ